MVEGDPPAPDYRGNRFGYTWAMSALRHGLPAGPCPSQPKQQQLLSMHKDGTDPLVPDYRSTRLGPTRAVLQDEHGLPTGFCSSNPQQQEEQLPTDANSSNDDQRYRREHLEIGQTQKNQQHQPQT